MKRTIGDCVSGKLGNVVFVQSKGNSYVRTAPLRKANNWSTSQVLYRKRLSNISALWRSISSPEIKNIWNLASSEMNGYAYFIKKNIPALTIAGDLIDPLLISATDGKLTFPPFTLEREVNPSNTVHISWVNDPNLKPVRLTDHLMVMSYGPDPDSYRDYQDVFSPVCDTHFKRNDTTGVVIKPPLHGSTFISHLFFFFASADQLLYSPSRGFRVTPNIMDFLN